MLENALALFLYDQFEYFLGNAFGTYKKEIKIAYNPLMIQCLHPSCLAKSHKPIKLKHIFDLKPFLKHLKTHFDAIGEAMQTRFEAIYQDRFTSVEELNMLSESPFSLMNYTVNLTDEGVRLFNLYAISRKYPENYICHWKNLLLRCNLIDCSSLSFQEDDARIFMALHHPNPVPNWSRYNTLWWYSLKMMVSISSAAVNLYRGISDYSRLSGNKTQVSVKDMMKSINHPAPSLSSLSRFFPPVEHSIHKAHLSELVFHLTVLMHCNDTVKVSYDDGSIVRIVVTLGSDEQGLNAGIFIHEDRLLGLEQPLTVADLKKIGLPNFAHHIATSNPYLTAVREYRLTDLKGCMSSNIYTSFMSKALNEVDCIDKLKEVANISKTCLSCLRSEKECSYTLFHQKCDNCQSGGHQCISMVVVNVLWDMGSAHKATAKHIDKIDLSSNLQQYSSSDLFSVGFGGLHLCKCVVNTLRCYSVSNHDENFGIYILRALRRGTDECAQELALVKNAVIEGKDRQSDLLSWMTCGPQVQKGLKLKDYYCAVRVPEPLLFYKENAKTQKVMVLPVAVSCNNNGDVFVLDKGGCCLHVFDRSDVVKGYTVGKYKQASQDCKTFTNARDVVFSDSLKALNIQNDNVYIADGGRNDVVILRRCLVAKTVRSRPVCFLKIESCDAIVGTPDSLLIVLCSEDGNQTIKVLNHKLPSSSSANRIISFSILHEISPSYEVQGLFTCNFFSIPRMFGIWTTSFDVILFESSEDSFCFQDSEVGLKSAVLPASSQNYLMISQPSQNISELYKVSILEGSFVFNKDHTFEESFGVPVAYNIWGSVINAVSGDQDFILIECGRLRFAVEFCEAVESFYRAIGYVPPHGDNSVRQMNIMESIAEGEKLCTLLSSMQESRLALYPQHESFRRNYGIPYTGTIQCIQMSVDGWKSIADRLNSLSPGLHLEIYPHSVANEYLVENAFGMVMKAGQGHLQTAEEYTTSKRKHSLNFQMNMCETPFHQYQKVKVRDKGYQELNPALKSKLKLNDLREIFSRNLSGKSNKGNSSEVEVSEEDKCVLKSFYHLSKSVPRQTNRCKWRAAAEQTPNLPAENDDGKVKEGDIVFYESLDGIMYLIVVKDMLLLNVDSAVEVKQIDSSDIHRVPVNKLLVHDGKIVILPSYLYSVEENEIIVADIAHTTFTHILEKCRYKSILSDEEWFTLFESEDTEKTDAPKKGVSSKKNKQPNTSDKNPGRLFRKMVHPPKKKPKMDEGLLFQRSLIQTWKQLLPPVDENSLKDKWICYVYLPAETKKKYQLIFAKLKHRFLHDNDGSNLNLCKWQVDSCKPYRVASNSGVIEEIRNGEIWNVNIHDIIYAYVTEEDSALIAYLKQGQW